MKALLGNWELKLTALFLAFALWAFVVTSEQADLVLSAPVELDAAPAGLQVAGERPDNVDVQVHGLRTAIARLAPEHVRVRVSLAGARAGEVVVRISPEEVVVPPGVTVTRVSPARIRVVLEAASPRRGGA